MQLENLSPHSAARGSDLETSGCRFLEKPLIRVEPHVLGHLESVWDRHEARNVRLIPLIGVRENSFPPPLKTGGMNVMMIMVCRHIAHTLGEKPPRNQNGGL